MKLHLPSGLRKALLACLAALAFPAFTVSSGAALFGGVAFSFLAGQQALAQEPADSLIISDEEDDESSELSALISALSDDYPIMPISVTPPCDYTVQDYVADMEITGNVALDVTSVRDIALTATDATANLKLIVSSGENHNFTKNLQLNSLWVTGGESSVGRIQVEAERIASVGTIYVDGASIWFKSGSEQLTTHFVIAESTWTGDGESNFHNAALRTSGNINTSGTLTLQGDSALSAQSGSAFTFNGAVVGAGHTLQFDNWGNGTLNLFGGGTLGGIVINPDKDSAPQNRGNSNVYLQDTFIFDGASSVGNKGFLTLNENASLSIQTLDIQTGGTMTVNANASLEVTGDLTVDGELLVGQNNGPAADIFSVAGSTTVGGTLTLRSGSSATFSGSLDVTGTLKAWGSDIILEQGGSIANLDASWGNGFTLYLGDDLEFSGLARGTDNGSNPAVTITKSLSAEELKTIYLVKKIGSDGETLADMDAFIASFDSADNLTIGEELGLGKSGAGTLTFSSATTTISRDFIVKEGSVVFQNGLTIDNINLTVASGASIQSSGALTASASAVGAHLYLGGDMTVTGLAGDAASGVVLSAAADAESATLKIERNHNDAVGNMQGWFTVDTGALLHINITGNGLNRIGWQRMTGQFRADGSIRLQSGALEFESTDTNTIAGNVVYVTGDKGKLVVHNNLTFASTSNSELWGIDVRGDSTTTIQGSVTLQGGGIIGGWNQNNNTRVLLEENASLTINHTGDQDATAFSSGSFTMAANSTLIKLGSGTQQLGNQKVTASGSIEVREGALSMTQLKLASNPISIAKGASVILTNQNVGAADGLGTVTENSIVATGSGEGMAVFEIWNPHNVNLAAQGSVFGEGLHIKLHVNTTNSKSSDRWTNWTGISVLGELDLYSGQMFAQGTNVINKFVADEESYGYLVQKAGTTTVKQDSVIGGFLFMQGGSIVLGGNLELLGGGIQQNNAGGNGSITTLAEGGSGKSGIHIHLDSRESHQYSNEATFSGNLTLTGKFVMDSSTTSHTQTLSGGTIQADGGFEVRGGTLKIAGATHTLIGNVTVGSGSYTNAEGVTSVTYGTLSWEAAGLTIEGDLTVNGGTVFSHQENWDGADHNALRISDGLTVNGALNFQALASVDSDYSSNILLSGLEVLGGGLEIGPSLTVTINSSGESDKVVIAGAVTGAEGSTTSSGVLQVVGTTGTSYAELRSGGSLSQALVAKNANISIGADLTVAGLKSDVAGSGVTVGGYNGAQANFILNATAEQIFQGALTVSAGTTLVKKGSGNQVLGGAGFNPGSAGEGITTINGDLRVEAGTLRIINGANITGAVQIGGAKGTTENNGAKLSFWKNSGSERTIVQKVTGNGTLETIDQLLTLHDGADIGNLSLCWGASLALGADLLTGGISWVATQGDRAVFTNISGQEYVTLDVSGTAYTNATSANSSKLGLSAGVRFNLADGITQRVWDSSFADLVTLGSGSVLQVDGGATTTISAANALRDSSADSVVRLSGNNTHLSITGGGSYVGAVEMGGGNWVGNNPTLQLLITENDMSIGALKVTNANYLGIESGRTLTVTGALTGQNADAQLIVRNGGSVYFAGGGSMNKSLYLYDASITIIGDGQTLSVGNLGGIGSAASNGKKAVVKAADGGSANLWITTKDGNDSFNTEGYSIEDSIALTLKTAAEGMTATEMQLINTDIAASVTLENATTLVLESGENTVSGSVYMESGSRLNVTGGTSNTLSGSLTLDAGSALTVSGGVAEITGELIAGANGAGTVNANGGSLTISGTPETTPFGGTLAFGGGSVELNRDLTVGNLTATDSANNSLSGSGVLTVDVGEVDQVSATGRLSITDVELVKAGSASYELTGLSTTGKVTVREGNLTLNNASSLSNTLTVQEQSTATFKGSSSLSGDLQGSGDIILNAGSLAVSGSGVPADGFTGRVSLRSGSVLSLERDFVIGGLSDLDLASVSGTQQITGSGHTLTLNVADGKTESSRATINAGADVTIVKSGAGVQELLSLSADKVTVSQGTLRLLGNSGKSTFTDTINTLTVDGASLEVQRHNWNSADTHIILANGASMVAEVTPRLTPGQSAELKLGTLTLSGSEVNRFKWSVAGSSSGEEVSGQQSVTFAALSGAGTLLVDDFGHSVLDDASNRRRLVFSQVKAFSGLLEANEVLGPYSRIVIGQVDQAARYDGSIDIGGGVYSNSFRKSGAGAIRINQLNAIMYNGLGDLYMDYDGVVSGIDGTGSLPTLTVANGVTLCYTRGEDSNQLHWDVAGLESLQDGVILDVSQVLNSPGGADKLRNGISLGITGVAGYSADQLAALMDKLELSEAANDTKWSLESRGDTLWLIVDEFIIGETDWDANWAEGNGLRNAPTTDHMADAMIHIADIENIKGSSGDFTSHALALAANSNAGDYSRPGQRLILLNDGDTATDTMATVLGGVLQAEDDAALQQTSFNTFILLQPEEGKADAAVRYHLLVGASSCTSNSTDADDTSVGGFEGQTHIQVEGGTVDYIVGGNHVTNRAFTFEGSSFISVKGGDVRGGIVGGSVLTLGSTSDRSDVTEFLGSSYIYIYTALHNDATTPALSIGDGVVDSAFTAIVGGNAWVGLPGNASADMTPTFAANSHITIDLASEPTDAPLSFEKDIVGGNYTVFREAGSEESQSGRSTIFQGDAYITISIGDRADEDAVFTGSIVGASRRASGGAGYTEFYGNTYVTINGGTFQKAIVGGMRFDSTATGKHSALLSGDTHVTINGGNIWRVVGGSYSLAGDEGASDDKGAESEGNSFVSITGGVFSSDFGVSANEGQQQRAFIAGGDFYRNTKGSNHNRLGNTSVDISGGSFLNLHIVGGDYANMSGVDAGQGVAISGESQVSIAGGDITGLVVGGSYLTDEVGQGGGVSVQSSRISMSGGTLTAEGADSEHDHKGIAVVAGHVIIDEGAGSGETGGHSATVLGDTSITISGGSITGHLVGGSYANETDGVNELSNLGSNSIVIAGGSITGNVYGGHYSENTTSPDTLALNDVSILLTGGTVSGSIYGGNFRSAQVPAANGLAPTQGNITISLLGGTLTGSVYAAGHHTGADAALSVETESTTVNVGAGVKLSAGHTVSGGYRKTSAADVSSVGSSLLAFVDNAEYTNLDGVRWTEFDTVDTVADVTLTGVFRAASNKDSFTKSGAGKLTLSTGVAAADGSAFAGSLQINDGILAVGAEQKLVNLGFDLSTRLSRNDIGSAYLQAVDGGSLTKGASGLIGVQVSSDKQLVVGSYYLTGPLSIEGVSRMEAADIFDVANAGLELLSIKDTLQADLILKDNCLVLHVHHVDTNMWYWTGDESGTWSNASARNWTRDQNATLEGDVADGEASGDMSLADVHFDAGADDYNVVISGEVTPHNVFIDSGDYTFSAHDSSTEGINIVNGGSLIVGTDNVDDPASLTLTLGNKSIPSVVIHESGSLTLAAANALSSSIEKVDFDGGLLVFAQDAESGELLYTADLSSKVAARDEAAGVGRGVIRLQVGDPSAATMRMAAAAGATPVLQWGSGDSRDTNMGLERALNDGIDKTGKGILEISWTESAAAELSGSVAVQDGTLRFALSTDDEVTMAGADGMSLAAGSSIEFEAMGAGRLVVNRSFSGEGAVVIGSAVSTASFRLGSSADNRAFNGSIALVGSSAQQGSQVSVLNTDALGGKGTLLQLQGRHIRLNLSGASSASINAGTVDVVEGSTNYLGGVSLTDTSNANAHITLTGNVTGKGVLANALGGFSHKLTGDLSGFEGVLVAGAQGVGVSNGTKLSSWSLAGRAPSVINMNLAGSGIIDFAFTGADSDSVVLLAGAVGDASLGRDTSLRNSSSTVVALVDGGKNSSLGQLILVDGSAGFQIGIDKDSTGSWLGSVQGVGTLTLVSGSIARVTNNQVMLVADIAQGAHMDVNGTEGGIFNGISIKAGGRLDHVSGAITASGSKVLGTSKVSLVLDVQNIDDAPGAAEDYMIGMSQSGQLYVVDADGLDIDVSNEALFELLVDFRRNDANLNRAYMHIVDQGELAFANGLQDHLGDLFTGTAQILTLMNEFHLDHDSSAPGDLVLTGVSTNIYMVIGPDGQESAQSDSRTITDWNQFDGYVATVVDHDATLTISPADHNPDTETGDNITVRNLVGLEGSTLWGSSMPDSSEYTIELNNSTVQDDIIDDTGLSNVGDFTKSSVHGVDTTFLGVIGGEFGANFRKTGKGTLTVGSADTGNGGLNIQGELALQEGALHVAGNRGESGNELGFLVFDYDSVSADPEEERGLLLSGGSTSVHGIVERGAYKGDDVVRLGEDGVLVVKDAYDDVRLTGVRFVGEGGSLSVDNAHLILDSEGAQSERIIDADTGVVNGGKLTLANGSVLSGGLLAAEDGSIVVDAASISNAAVSLGENSSLALENASTLSTEAAIELKEGSSMVISSDSKLTAAGGLTLDGTLDLADTVADVTGLAGSGTIFGWEPQDSEDNRFASLIVHGTDNSFSGSLSGAGKISIGAKDALTLSGVAHNKSSKGSWDVDNQGALTVDLTGSARSSLGSLNMGSASTTIIVINTDEAERMGKLDLENLTWDGGAKLIINNDAAQKALTEETIDLGRLTGIMSSGEIDITLDGLMMMHYESGELRQENDHWLLDLVETNKNKLVSDRMEKNARAGGEMLWEASKNSSANWRRILNDPMSPVTSDLYKLVKAVDKMDIETQEAQMSRVLAAAAGASVAVLGSALSQDLERQLHAVRNRTTSIMADDNHSYHVWMNGEGSYHKLDADSLAPGYSLSSWGGTVGMDVSLSANTTIGLALSALYGNLKTDAADNGRGDLDTTYATFFARVAKGSWLHTFLFSGGVADISLNRTVNYGSGSYSAKGSTDGYAVGALYELGYANVMNAEGTFLLQSVVNIELRHVGIGGYSESNTDAGLVVDDASYTTLTIGAGARLQSVIGGNALNRSALFEARFLVKADAGDRSGKVQNDLINGNNAKRELESAEIGAVGIEVGAGVTVPVGKRGSIFLDGSLEVRSGYSSMDANIGYRLSF